MICHFEIQKLVPFADTDMGGIVHFTNYLTYMEEAEHAFLRSVGLRVVMSDERGAFGFPKLSAECQYRRPVRCEDTLKLLVSADASDGKSLRFHCEFQLDGEVVAEGKLHVACCRFPDDGGLPFAIPIPDDVMERLKIAQARN